VKAKSDRLERYDYQVILAPLERLRLLLQAKALKDNMMTYLQSKVKQVSYEVTVGASEAHFQRKMEAGHPTVLVEELEAFLEKLNDKLSWCQHLRELEESDVTAAVEAMTQHFEQEIESYILQHLSMSEL